MEVFKSDFYSVPVLNDNLSKSSNAKIERKDIHTILLLLLLYTIQGIPIGLKAAIPIVIHNRADYSQIAWLSLAGVPFCLKLLWAPILDFVYFKRFGKRKSWLIPVQLLCGLFLLYGSFDGKIDRWLGTETEGVDVVSLFIYFLILHFLVATQDIAVDGWALTMLPQHLKHHASTCNAAGQAFGINVAFLGFITLNVPESSTSIYHFWRKFCGILNIANIEEGTHVGPLVSLSGFTRFFGIIIIVCTILISFKNEPEDKPTLENDVEDIELSINDITERAVKNRDQKSIIQIYSTLKKVCNATNEMDGVICLIYYFRGSPLCSLPVHIVSLKPVRLLMFTFITKTIYNGPDDASDLKLLERGLPKDALALMTPLMVPFEIIGPPIIARFISSYRASGLIVCGLYLKIVSMILSAGFVYITGKYYQDYSKDAYFAKLLYYALFFSIFSFRKIVQMIMFVADVALSANKSDPTLGGTYMTLLNTICNIGRMWPYTLTLLLIDFVTIRTLNAARHHIQGEIPVSDETESEGGKEYKTLRENVDTLDYSSGVVDGIYVEYMLCLLFGIFTLGRYSRWYEELESFPIEEWHLNN